MMTPTKRFLSPTSPIMRHLLLCVAISGIAMVSQMPQAYSQTTPLYRTLGRIESLDSSFNNLIGEDAEIEVLASGFTWTEGPVWVPSNASVDGCEFESGCLLFSDIPRNTIFRWTPGRGIDTFMNPSGYTGVSYYGLEPGSNGLMLDGEGRLCMCEHGDRRVSMLTPGGGKLTLADRYDGKRLNSPNDLVFDQAGNLYFTDPPYGLPNRESDPLRQLDHFGVYRRSADGKIELLTTEMTRPNGIGLSPDEKTLYIAQSDPQRPVWVAFDLKEDGKLGPQRELADASEFMKEFPGLPDGMAVHSSGTLFGSGPGGIYVMTPAGKLIGRIVTGGRTSNCTFDPSESWLFITNDANLCRVRMK
ncbi:SMP-30/gluconolactonase/LRE family protein [Neorhodopirellula pilleata]|uniref:Gluconolactonase n=1 Tax=Neorhodopirellula pilleata TaxID=2714738 RepID=A0A5C6AW49_9BACT|nr:Gluconolactonase precursor [Neorhodopirellula pilleata]